MCFTSSRFTIELKPTEVEQMLQEIYPWLDAYEKEVKKCEPKYVSPSNSLAFIKAVGQAAIQDCVYMVAYDEVSDGHHMACNPYTHMADLLNRTSETFNEVVNRFQKQKGNSSKEQGAHCECVSVILFRGLYFLCHVLSMIEVSKH